MIVLLGRKHKLAVLFFVVFFIFLAFLLLLVFQIPEPNLGFSVSRMNEMSVLSVSQGVHGFEVTNDSGSGCVLLVFPLLNRSDVDPVVARSLPVNGSTVFDLKFGDGSAFGFECSKGFAEFSRSSMPFVLSAKDGSAVFQFDIVDGKLVPLERGSKQLEVSSGQRAWFVVRNSDSVPWGFHLFYVYQSSGDVNSLPVPIVYFGEGKQRVNEPLEVGKVLVLGPVSFARGKVRLVLADPLCEKDFPESIGEKGCIVRYVDTLKVN